VAILFIAMSKHQTIYRVINPVGFFQTPNELPRDPRMSFGAKGVMSLVLSNCDEWEVTRDYLLRHTNEPANRVKKYMKELEAFGYAHHKIESFGRGTFRNIWTFYTVPLPADKRSNKTNWRGVIDLKVLEDRNIDDRKPSDHQNTIPKNTINKNTIYDTEDIVSGYGDEEEYQGEIRGLW
jgi:hypothetical protein